MRIIVDTHVHLYPCYNLARALHCLNDSLAFLHRDAIRVGLLTDRHDYRASDVLGGLDLDSIRITSLNGDSWRVEFTRTGGVLYLVSGRQVVTRENIEVLALCTGAAIDDGQPAPVAVEAIKRAGGVPVLSWSPGKWLGGRGTLVHSLMDRFGPDVIFLGDTTLRPAGLPQPALFRRGVRQGYRLLAGTDALPCAGEERHLGVYATLFDGVFDSAAPLDSMRSVIKGPAIDLRGARKNILAVAHWLVRDRFRRKKSCGHGV